MKTETLSKPIKASESPTGIEQSQAVIKISDIIFSKTNEEFTRSPDKDFIASIKTQGVLQPILVRPVKNGKYECVCGERRTRAATAAGLEFIPAKIQHMTDDEALSAQISENVNREDLTPFQEAKVFKIMYQSIKDFWDEGDTAIMAEMMRRIGKGESYIAQRMKLTDLIPGIVKMLIAGDIQLGHALIACRLRKEDQEQMLEENLQYDIPNVKEFEGQIERDYLLKLSSAPWKKDDKDLVAKAGSCNACPKRTGANPMLFGDVKKIDNCLDGTCFAAKMSAHTLNKVKDLIENKPDIAFAKGYQEADEAIVKYLNDNSIKLLKEYTDFHEYKRAGAPEMKVFYLSGSDQGKIKTVYANSIKAKSKIEGNKKGGNVNLSASIAGIKQRTKRAAELDDEKVYVRIIEGLQKSESFKKTKTSAAELPIDKLLMRWIILEHKGYDGGYISGSGLRLTGSAEAQLKEIEKLSDKEFIQIARRIMLKEYAGQATNAHCAEGKILRRLAEALKEVPVNKLVDEQREIRIAREDRAEARIEKLKSDAKSGKVIKPNKIKAIAGNPEIDDQDEQED